LVTHDFGLVAEMCDEVAVMYAGQIVERGPVEALFERPAHPYTRALMGCRPEICPPDVPLPVIPGQVPTPGAWPAGCRFEPRCPHAAEVCQAAVDEDAWQDGSHAARCLRVPAVMEDDR
ncbi:MAG: ABC transporter ATP-binding protein, partial [Bacteroidetes bacterium]